MRKAADKLRKKQEAEEAAQEHDPYIEDMIAQRQAAKKNKDFALADKIRESLDKMGVSYLVNSTTNQIFPIMQEKHLKELRKNFTFTEMERVDDTHRCIRFCTSWATKEENVQVLIDELRRLCR